MSYQVTRTKTRYPKGVLKKEDALKKESTVGSYRMTYYYFNCSGCGCELKLQSGSLKTHTGKCRNCSQRGLPFEASYNELLNSSKTKLKDIEYKQVYLTYEDYYDLCQVNHCHYCLEFLNRKPYTKENGLEVNSGRSSMLDRKDNLIGYTKENCVPCC